MSRTSVADIAVKAIENSAPAQVTGRAVTTDFVAELLAELVPGVYAGEGDSTDDVSYALNLLENAIDELRAAHVQLSERYDELDVNEDEED